MIKSFNFDAARHAARQTTPGSAYSVKAQLRLALAEISRLEALLGPEADAPVVRDKIGHRRAEDPTPGFVLSLGGLRCEIGTAPGMPCRCSGCRTGAVQCN